MNFVVGDRVQRRPEHEKDKSVPPCGSITAIKPWGKGQLVKIDNSSRVWPAGYFEKEHDNY